MHSRSLLSSLQQVSTVNPDSTQSPTSQDLRVTKSEEHLCLWLFIFLVLPGASSSKGGASWVTWHISWFHLSVDTYILASPAVGPSYLTYNIWFSFEPPFTLDSFPLCLPPPQHSSLLFGIVKFVSPHHASLLSPRQTSTCDVSIHRLHTSNTSSPPQPATTLPCTASCKCSDKGRRSPAGSISTSDCWAISIHFLSSPLVFLAVIPAVSTRQTPPSCTWTVAKLHYSHSALPILSSQEVAWVIVPTKGGTQSFCFFSGYPKYIYLTCNHFIHSVAGTDYEDHPKAFFLINRRMQNNCP